jgi:hypothetical protein
MRRVVLLLAGLTLVLAACGAGVPIDDAEGPETEALTEADGSDVSADDPVEEPGGASSAATDEPIELKDETPTDTTLPEGEVIPEEQTPKPVEPTPTVPEQPPAESTVPVVTGEAPGDLLDSILADAESRVTTESAISVVRAQAVTWSDGSLGCPEPGMSYTQALVEGYWVVLDAGGRQMDYRATAGGAFKLCEAYVGVPPVDDTK